MTLPALPAQGSTAWYPWASGIHNAVSSSSVAAATGNATTDTAAIAAALTAGAGGTVALGAGNYWVNGITVPANTALDLRGATLTEKRTTGSGATVTLGAGASIRRGNIVGNRATAHAGVAVTMGAGTAVADLIISEAGGAGVEASSITGYSISNCVITNCDGQGINVVFANIGRITGCYINTAVAGIQWWGGDSSTYGAVGMSDLTISSCTVKNVSSGIWGSLATRVTVTGCSVETCSDVGIDFEGCTYSTATGCTVKDATNGGMTVFYASTNVAFTSCVVTGAGSAFKSFGTTTPNSNISVNGCTLVSSGTTAFYTDQSSMTRSRITNCVIASSSTTVAPVRLLDCDEVGLIGNEINGAFNVGISLEGGSYCQVLDNRIKCTVTDTSAVGVGGAILLYWRSSSFPTQRNQVKNNYARNFTTGVKDHNWGDTSSFNSIVGNIIPNYWHLGTTGSTYLAYVSDNRQFAPATASTEVVGP